jgi:hypothetical protein
VLLETALLDLVLSAGLRTKVIHARCAWEQDHASNTLDGFCSELAQKPFPNTVGGVHNVNRSFWRIRFIYTRYDTLDDCLLSHLIYIEYDLLPETRLLWRRKVFLRCLSTTLYFLHKDAVLQHACDQRLLLQPNLMDKVSSDPLSWILGIPLLMHVVLNGEGIGLFLSYRLSRY